MFTEEHLPFAFWIPSHQPGHGYQSPQALVCLEVIGGALFAGCPCVVSTALQTLVCLLKEAPTHLTPTPRVCLNVFKRFPLLPSAAQATHEDGIKDSLHHQLQGDARCFLLFTSPARRGTRFRDQVAHGESPRPSQGESPNRVTQTINMHPGPSPAKKH